MTSRAEAQATVVVPAFQQPEITYGYTFKKMVSAGVAASIAELATIPVDTAKVRLQIQGENEIVKGTEARSQLKYRGMIRTIATIVKEEGASTLYKGLTAGVQRQMCFCGIRIGLYDSARKFYGDDGHGKPRVMVKIAASITTASTAVLMFQPTETVKIRFQAAGANTPYKSALDAYTMIARTEGMKGLWRGCSTNVVRLSVVNCTEIVCYDIVKSRILYEKWMKDGTPLHFLSATVAGFLTTVIASPIDVVKTRFTNSPAGSYKTPFHCALSVAKQNGLSAFYKGFVPSFTRLCSWTIVMFLSFEQIKKATNTHH